MVSSQHVRCRQAESSCIRSLLRTTKPLPSPSEYLPSHTLFLSCSRRRLLWCCPVESASCEVRKICKRTCLFSLGAKCRSILSLGSVVGVSEFRSLQESNFATCFLKSTAGYSCPRERICWDVEEGRDKFCWSDPEVKRRN